MAKINTQGMVVEEDIVFSHNIDKESVALHKLAGEVSKLMKQKFTGLLTIEFQFNQGGIRNTTKTIESKI